MYLTKRTLWLSRGNVLHSLVPICKQLQKCYQTLQAELLRSPCKQNADEALLKLACHSQTTVVEIVPELLTSAFSASMTTPVKPGHCRFWRNGLRKRPTRWHGRPLSADDWDTQMLFFLKHGYRVIAPSLIGRSRTAQKYSHCQNPSALGESSIRFRDLDHPHFAATSFAPSEAVCLPWKRAMASSFSLGSRSPRAPVTVDAP
jgi:hypothetical protein